MNFGTLIIRIITSLLILFASFLFLTFNIDYLFSFDVSIFIFSFNILIVLPFVDQKLLYSKSENWWPQVIKIVFILLTCSISYNYLPDVWLTNIIALEGDLLFSLTFSILPVCILLIVNKPFKKKKIKTLVFLCYRRLDDENHIVTVVADSLRKVFEKESIFKDIENMKPGDNFRKLTAIGIKESRVFLLIIGKKWIKRNWSDEKENEVYRELKIALSKRKKIVPVYINNAKLLEKNDLPKDLEIIPDLQSLRIRSGDDFTHDIEKVISAVRISL